MAITKGHEVLCCDRNRRGGLKNIWLMDKDNVTATTVADNIYTTFTSTNVFQFDFDRYTGQFNANATRENGSTVVSVELIFYIPKVTPAVNSTLDDLASSCGLIAICESYADDCAATAATYKFVLGYDEIFEAQAYLDFTSGEETTGAALQDANGATVTLSGDAAMYPLGLSATMTAPVGVYTDAWTIA
tara:strand:- start:3262 stop:3828 length:567 start_codon:yes stop_codon:yes gene_type:complete